MQFAILEAIRYGQSEIIRELSKYESVIYGDGSIPALFAIIFNQPISLRTLLELGVDVDAVVEGRKRRSPDLAHLGS